MPPDPGAAGRLPADHQGQGPVHSETGEGTEGTGPGVQ